MEFDTKKRKASEEKRSAEDSFNCHAKPFESGLAADFVLEKLINRLFSRIESTEIDNKLCNYTSKCVTSAAKDIATVYTLGHDNGEPTGENVNRDSHDWSASAEPVSF